MKITDCSADGLIVPVLDNNSNSIRLSERGAEHMSLVCVGCVQAQFILCSIYERSQLSFVLSQGCLALSSFLIPSHSTCRRDKALFICATLRGDTLFRIFRIYVYEFIWLKCYICLKSRQNLVLLHQCILNWFIVRLICECTLSYCLILLILGALKKR